MHTLDQVDAASLRSDIPDFRAGDTLKVNVKVVEGNRSRIQAFQGVVIARQGDGVRETFTVRKVSFQVGVERTFPVHSPSLESIEVVTRGDVRRAKLYYLRKLRGKKAKIKEKRDFAPGRRRPEPPRTRRPDGRSPITVAARRRLRRRCRWSGAVGGHGAMPRQRPDLGAGRVREQVRACESVRVIDRPADDLDEDSSPTAWPGPATSAATRPVDGPPDART